MKELQDIVNSKVCEMIENGTIEEAIKKNVESAITKAIASQFQSYGSITQQIENSIKDGLRINTNDLPFETYNKQMLVAIKQRLGAMFQGAASEKFIEEIDKVLDPAPKEMTVNEFVETIAEFWKTDEPWDADDLDEHATVEVEQYGDGDNNYTLKMWKQKGSYGEGLSLFIMNDVIRLNHKQSYNPTIFHDHESFVFKLYAAGTKITGLKEFDEDDCDLLLKDTDY